MSKRPKSAFARALAARVPKDDGSGRRWVFVPYDQLTDAIGPLSEHGPQDTAIALVECPEKARRRPYHKQKLALVLANLRHFALEQAERGVLVRHVVARKGYAEALRALAREVGPLELMEPAERELRLELAPLVAQGRLSVVPHAGWLTSREEFLAGAGAEPPWRMDRFYKHVRRARGLLMEDGEPLGGRWSFDADNRDPWKGEPPAPEPPRFASDPIKEEVLALVAERFADHPGALDGESLPATQADAEAAWRFALEECLPRFGPWQDAMSREHEGLFHTRVSPLLNLHRLLPERVVREAAALDAPLASREGFVRQVLGWREFVRHVHRETDGFRELPRGSLGSGEPGAPSFLRAGRPLPPAFWGEPSGLACLDQVVGEVWRHGWSHHTTRLMVLANVASLLDVSPRELTDWFWVAYVDAFDWVVEPNVLGMGTFAAGDLMTTKPYVCGAPYVSRMSDYCGSCAFDPRKDCPLTPLYWAFLARNEERLAKVGRASGALRGLGRRSAEKRRADRALFREVAETLARGERLAPERSVDARGESS